MAQDVFLRDQLVASYLDPLFSMSDRFGQIDSRQGIVYKSTH